MKLSPPPRFGSFYESFSDLIFATMAIFVLLMTVFMVITHDIGDVEAINEQTELAKEKLIEEQLKLDSEEDELKTLKDTIKGIKTSNIELVFVIDTSGSMKSELAQLNDTIRVIGKVMPQVSKTLRIGIVGYRQDANGRDETRVFKMRDILSSARDGGQSYQSIRRFTRNLKAGRGPAPVDKAIKTAISMFSPKDFIGHQVIVLIGDVGPYESYLGDHDISAVDRQSADKMQRMLTTWQQQKTHRNLVVLFSGVDEIQNSKGLTARENKYRESQALFKRIASATGQKENYTEHTGKMLPYVLGAVLKP